MAHVLVAEDDFDDRQMMEETFSTLGRKDSVSFVDDGGLVMDFLESNPTLPIRLIVLDLNMPKVNGTEALKRLKSHPAYKDIPVIIFSTSVNNTEREKAMLLGAVDYLTKPCYYADYMETCQLFLRISEDQT